MHAQMLWWVHSKLLYHYTNRESSFTTVVDRELRSEKLRKNPIANLINFSSETVSYKDKKDLFHLVLCNGIFNHREK